MRPALEEKIINHKGHQVARRGLRLFPSYDLVSFV